MQTFNNYKNNAHQPLNSFSKEKFKRFVKTFRPFFKILLEATDVFITFYMFYCIHVMYLDCAS